MDYFVSLHLLQWGPNTLSLAHISQAAPLYEGWHVHTPLPLILSSHCRNRNTLILCWSSPFFDHLSFLLSIHSFILFTPSCLSSFLPPLLACFLPPFLTRLLRACLLSSLLPSFLTLIPLFNCLVQFIRYTKVQWSFIPSSSSTSSLPFLLTTIHFSFIHLFIPLILHFFIRNCSLTVPCKLQGFSNGPGHRWQLLP